MAVFVTSRTWSIDRPWVFLSVLVVLTAVQFLFRTNRARHIFSSVILILLVAFDLLFIIIYEMTGTIFDFAMLNLRADAMAILESVPINFNYTVVAGILLSAFIVFGNDAGVLVQQDNLKPTTKRILSGCLVLLIVLQFATARVDVTAHYDDEALVQETLYGKSEEGYADQGIVGNLISEVCMAAFDDVEVGTTEEINDFLYASVSDDSVPWFGAAEGYNVVTILGETFEWFSFLQNPEIYPNGHWVGEEVLRELYPNLYAFYDSSVVMTNFYAREKTDISENLSLIGNYPLNYYLNYDYPENHIAYSLPNVMKTLYNVESKSFHNGTETFYNRNEYLTQAVGFSEFVSAENMAGEAMVNYIEVGERNLDAEMIEACKEEMFPTNRRFNTYITTITMHGKFEYRENLEPYYEILDSVGFLPVVEEEGEEPDLANIFRYYAAAAMEFDRAIGAMMSYLEETGLINNTLVVLFGDHNAYYQSLSNYVKDIYPQTEPDAIIPELYRVPLMIKVGDQVEESIIVDKFTCTADILPTMMSLLGIRYYTNLYYGNSVFADEESVLYSRAYDVFITDRLYFTSLDNILYAAPDVDGGYCKNVEKRALELLEKVTYVNRIFAADFFTGTDLKNFEDNLRQINQISWYP